MDSAVAVSGSYFANKRIKYDPQLACKELLSLYGKFLLRQSGHTATSMVTLI